MYKKATSELTQALKKVNSYEDFEALHKDDLTQTSLDQLLKHYAGQAGLTIYNIINTAEIDQSYGYKIFRGQHKPSRDIIIKLSIAMKLNLQNTQRLLKAGQVNELYPRNERDAIIIFAINNNMSLRQVDEILYSRKQETLVS
ncbi:XRE family transcriptional regulator [Acidaminobacter sp. JC074]|uniref:hypothetical protein n=1 Tax=Acidaminobacter sp. JC074 TaxID=2530199 RepID=UPI001F0DED59|nr:hypothetical protein [Acidaminobacter sp. JC074]MCH4890864.1 XRE family transcriptional regulator [Acidaminobacter sp. JC074]